MASAVYGALCVLHNGITSDRLTFCNSRKKLKHASYQNVWRHLVEHFLRGPQIFLHPIYRPHRAIQSCEGRILKLHTILEIFVKNFKLRTHFFGFMGISHSQIFDMFRGLLRSMKWPSDRLRTFLNEKN